MHPLKFPTYDAYQHSGVDWIGDIPAHWEKLAHKHIFRLKKVLVGKRSSEYQLLSLTLRGIVQRDMENPEGKFPAEFDTYQEVAPGDFVFCHFDVEETPRTVGLSEHAGMITGAYTVYAPTSDCDPRYLLHFHVMADTDKKLRGLYKGLRNTISKEAFGSFKMPMPPRDEQSAIAAFLDEKSLKIDEAIAAEERQIALLKERKQIVIQNAVTNGLNPNAPMKDSGVDWIGEIPAHWGVFPLFSKTRIKSVSNCADRDLLSVYLDLGVVKFSDVEEKRTNATSLDLSAYQAVDPGDFVLNNQQAWRGSVGVSMHTGIVSPAYIVLSLSSDFNPEFANYYFRSPALVSHYLIGSKGVGTIQRNLYWPKLRTTLISIPPIDEQIAIVKYIRTEAGKIDRAISLKNDQIAALREYKATLINSAVTGKIKVA